MKYRVKLLFLYSDTVEVEAESEEEAIDSAVQICDEQYLSFYDAETTAIKD